MVQNNDYEYHLTSCHLRYTYARTHTCVYLSSFKLFQQMCHVLCTYVGLADAFRSYLLAYASVDYAWSFWNSSLLIRPINFLWWRHQMEIFSALLALCAGNSPVTGEFPSQRPVTRSLDVFFHLCPNKRLSKQSWGWWFETPSRPLWRHCNVIFLSRQVTWRWSSWSQTT